MRRAFGLLFRQGASDDDVVAGLTSATTFDEFWPPHYLEAHENPVNRGLHCAGTVSPVLTLALALRGLGGAAGS